MKAAAIVYYAYVGFDMISTLAEDSKNPREDMPKSVYASMFISMFFYVLTSISMYGVARLDE